MILRAVASLLALLIIAVLLYLLAWPVPVEPVAWEAPTDRGLTGDFARNDALADLERIGTGDHHGPEDAVIDSDGNLYTGTEGGLVLRIRPDGEVSVFAETGGRPLGLEFDAGGNLIVANAYLGLQRIEPDGRVSLLTDRVDGEPIPYADDLDVAPDGRIYFSDASTKFGAGGTHGGTYDASLLDILEHGGHGRVLVYDPATDSTTAVMNGLNFANGVAVDPGGRFLLVNETGTYRVLKHWLAGPRSGETEVLLDNLPGFPDNINRGREGRYWIGLVSPRSKALDELSGRPFLRKVVQRLPAALRPQAVPFAHVVAIDAEGNVLASLQGDGSRLYAVTGALETADGLYLTSLFGEALGYLPGGAFEIPGTGP